MNRLLVLLCGIFGFVFAGCFQGQEKIKLKVINVLEKNYYDDAHIKGSINVPFMSLEQFVSPLNRKTPLVVYCANYHCSASGAAAQQLLKMGFSLVHAYEGGTAEWRQLGYPIDGPAQETYLTEVQVKPTEKSEVPVIDAVALKKLMEENKLL
jgi:rhodanese-related sulfurtransferase